MVHSDANPETIFTSKPTQWDTEDAEIEVRSVENPGFANVLPLKELAHADLAKKIFFYKIIIIA